MIEPDKNMEIGTLILDIISWINNYAVTNGVTSLVIGVSGGIDSAVVSTLCAKTGLDTYVITLPINQKEDQLTNAQDHITWLTENYTNVKGLEFDITKIFDTFSDEFPDHDSKLSLANSRSRLRMTTLYHIATNVGGIVVGTGNKVEDFGVGFYTKYGDGGVDISPIADLYKSEVYAIGKELDVSKEIQEARPTDGLWDDDRDDETQLGATYDELENIMGKIESGDTSLLTKREVEVKAIYTSLNQKNNHKMVEIPVYKK